MASALWRAAVFQTPSVVAALTTLFLGQRRIFETRGQTPWVAMATFWGISALLFSTARRQNGFAGMHDLASRTRVVRRPERDARSVLDTTRHPPRTDSTRTQRYGPYDVIGTLGPTNDVGELLVAFDPSLRRHVWIRTLPPDAPAVTPLVRDLSRPARLRWLSGRRSTSEAWDAYEALDGVPLATLLGAPRPWRMVRPWLLDLAREIDAGLKDESITALTIDHVWITRDGHAKLLDFRAPGVPPANQDEPVTLESGQTFLESVARCALDGLSCDESDTTTAARARDPLPLSASATLETLAHRGFTTSSEMVTRTAALLQACAGHHAADGLGSPASQCRAAHDAKRHGAERRPDPPVEPHAGRPGRAGAGAGRPRGVCRGSISIDDDYRSIHVYGLVHWPHS
jgi:hypothetical protein